MVIQLERDQRSLQEIILYKIRNILSEFVKIAEMGTRIRN
jgi:hypothetical protein